MVSTRSAALRVVSYNVLSSHLSAPSHFSTLNPEHLDATKRLPKVLTKLQREMDIGAATNGDKRSTIFCLQEVSYDWAGELHTFFANHGYHVVTGLYGKQFNGYMGVLTAYPTATLETVSIQISRLSDTYGVWPDVAPPPNSMTEVFSRILSLPQTFFGISIPAQQECPWTMAQRRSNALVTAVLRDRDTGTEFCVGNYHMPCLFYAPPVMVIHGDMCLAHVQRTNQPIVLAGDFNFKPTDPVYQLLTAGILSSENYPPSPAHQPDYTWQPTMQEPVASAYVEVLGHEPDFTNNARIGTEEPFQDTLDYIFVTKDCVQVESVLELPHRDQTNGPFPDENEPSDHVLIAANLRVKERRISDKGGE